MSHSDYHPTTGKESVLEVQKSAIYDWLCREFKNISDSLPVEEMVTDLDGKLWKLAGTLAEAGMWRSLQVALGLEEEKSLHPAGEGR